MPDRRKPSPSLVAARREPHAANARALTKAVTWRIIGTVDTFLWSYVVTHTPYSAGAIASFETVTKVGLFFLHERAWHLLGWAPGARLRSLLKAVSWRFVGSMDTFLLSFLVTGSARYAVSIATFEALSKIALYYLHERAWRTVRWGRLDAPPSTEVAPATP